MSFLNDFDTETMLNEQQQREPRIIKRKWVKEGFSHQCSLYGALTNKAEDKQAARRIEILSSRPYDENALKTLYNFFLEYPPLKIYTLWLYKPDIQGLKLVGAYD